MIRIWKFWMLISVSLLVSSCSDTATEKSTTEPLAPFPEIAHSAIESTTLKGKVGDWLFEGDGGCFIPLTDGVKVIETWSEADLCELAKIKKGSVIKVEVIYQVDEQQNIGDGQVPYYTIIAFLNAKI